MQHNDTFYLHTYYFNDQFKITMKRNYPFKFRVDPIPHTGGKDICIYGGVRRMKTTQERKWAYPHKKYIRGRRSARMLPNSWDDYWHARREKGWKRTKRKKRQWMKKGDKFNEKTDWIMLLVD